ncbi:MAG: hypothetical protein ABL901_03650 [Hyphomicrobiaceae bacterium]
MSKYGMGLLQGAQLGRKQLVAFAILSAIVNGLVTAVVGAWLAQTYSAYQKKTTAIQNIADLVYERRTRAGMVVWAIKRNAELDELRYRKRAYDEAFVAWNTKTQRNIFMIRDISGQKGVTRLETQFQDLLVPGLTATDHCLTKAYDLRLTGGHALPVLDACRMAELHQFTLDCAATFTNELDRLTRLSFLPWSANSDETRKAVEARIDKVCTALPVPKPAPEIVNAPGPTPAAAIGPATAATPADPAASLAPAAPEAAK